MHCDAVDSISPVIGLTSTAKDSKGHTVHAVMPLRLKNLIIIDMLSCCEMLGQSNSRIEVWNPSLPGFDG